MISWKPTIGYAIISIFILSIMLSATPIVNGQVASPAFISNYAVQDPNGNDVTEQSLVAGGTYIISFSITIGNTLNDKILLTTSLEGVGDRFWTLENDYPGVDTANWTPGASAVEFTAVEGDATFTLTGSVPAFYTEQFVDVEGKQFTIHFLKDLQLLVVSLESTRDVLDNRETVITDQVIISYDDLLESKRNVLDTAQIDPQYSELAWRVISEAEVLASAGYYDNAITLLNKIPQSGFPVPPVTTNIFMGATIGLGVIAVLLAFLLIKARSSRSLLSTMVHDESKKLDLLLVRATRIDKELASEIENIKKGLQDIK